MKETEREIDAVDCREAEAVMSGAVDRDIVKEDPLELVDSPWREEDPREERVEEENEGVCDSGGD